MNFNRVSSIKHLLFIFSVIFTFHSKAQSNYYFGYQDGFKYACQCTDIPPKNVVMITGTYNEGYRDGKIDGLIYAQRKNSSPGNYQNSRKSKPYDYNNSPMYTPNYELMERVLQQKQNLVNQRRIEIQQYHNNIIDIMYAAKARNNGFTQSQIDYLNWFNKESQKLASYDLTVNENYINIMNWLSSVKREALKW